MLFTITTTHTPATDLGYLLHKHPARVQTFELNFGQAYVFYPEAGPERCTAAQLLGIDPLHLVQTRHTTASHEFFVAALRQRPPLRCFLVPQRGYRRDFRDGAQRPLPRAARIGRHATTLAGQPCRPPLSRWRISAAMPI
jgi:hypothetical protein